MGGHASFEESRKNKCEKMSVFSSYFKAPSSRREKEGGGGLKPDPRAACPRNS